MAVYIGINSNQCEQFFSDESALEYAFYKCRIAPYDRMEHVNEYFKSALLKEFFSGDWQVFGSMDEYENTLEE